MTILESVESCLFELYISTLDQVRKLHFSINVHLTSVKEFGVYCNAGVILHNVGEVYIFKHMLNISAFKMLEHLSCSS